MLLRKIASWLPLSRYSAMIWLTLTFITISTLLRLGLIIFDGVPEGQPVVVILKVFMVGLIYDLSALSWLMIPFVLVAMLSGNGRKGRRIHGAIAGFLFAAVIVGLTFESFSEVIFWNEFASRFNFIAVDYLLFTREVIGNIRESYPLPALLSGVAVVSILIISLTLPTFWRYASAEAPTMKQRLALSAVLFALPVLVFFTINEKPHELMNSPASRELASNGLYSFFRAFRNNELDYREYYKTLPDKEVSDILGQAIPTADTAALTAHAVGTTLQDTTPNQHPRLPVKLPSTPENMVLVSIESLGSDYVDAFDGQRGLTPHLDALAREGLVFSNLYATGLRTVRGLEALSLSVPPTPGRAVLMREKNKQLQTLGSVFQSAGYEALYFYGGYSIFDNMKDFFGGNRYQVIDRTDIPSELIDHETIWGVADEDLFEHTLSELDKKAAAGQKFFAHVMTTSNHRPYTYPDNRVAIPSHTGREGAVQYTDWAVGQFIEQAKTKPWFRDTLFVFVADHTSHGRGRTDIPPENYRIPLIIYQPDLIAPEIDDRVASQIDVAPTLLSMMGINYHSRMFGQNLMDKDNYQPRAFMASYLTLGYMEQGLIAELGPMRKARVVDAKTGEEMDNSAPDTQAMIRKAVAFYQGASDYLQYYGRSEAKLN